MNTTGVVNHMMHACPSTSAAHRHACFSNSKWCAGGGAHKPLVSHTCGLYIDAMWARAEDPRNRTLADLQMVEYPASGDPSEPIDSMRQLDAVTLYDPCLLIFVCCKTFASFYIAMRKQICSR